ncbi:putative reverse transcriptase domain-containing protein [Tanacetum coccineum]
MQEVVLFYNGLDVPTRQILDSRGAIPSKTVADAKVAIQEMVEYSQKWHNGISRTRSPYYTKDFSLKEEGKTLEEAYYTQFGAPFQGGGYRATALGFYQRNNTNPSYQERRQSMEDTLSKFMRELVLQERRFGSLPSSTEANLRDQVKSISTIIEDDSYPIRRMGSSQYAELATMKYPKGIAKNVLVGIGKFVFPVDFIILDMYEDIKVPLILERPFLSTAHAKIDVFKMKITITLRVGEDKIIFKSVKPASSLIKRVYMLSLRERMELDLEVRLMGETLVLNRSLDPLNGDYIELNDLIEPLEHKRNQGDDLMPTIEEGVVIKEFRTRDNELDTGIDDYPRYCDYDKKICIDCTHNLKFSCMIGFEFIHINFFPLLYVNVMFKKFHNSIMKDKLVYKGNNIVGALMSVPIFVRTFSVVTDFAVLEDMDSYHDERMGDVIFGEPFLREVGIKARRFNRMITIYNGNESVTYQMVRSRSRFKHHTIEQMQQDPTITEGK